MKPTNHICKLCGREESRSENLIICAVCVQLLLRQATKEQKIAMIEKYKDDPIRLPIVERFYGTKLERIIRRRS
jgi:hypothetical protein